MIKSETNEIDRALELCYRIQRDLVNCVGFVQGLDRKYNEPDRYKYEQTSMHLDLGAKHLGSHKSSSLSSSTLSLDSCDGHDIKGRSSHELSAIFINLNNKYIKMRRELESSTAHAQRIIDTSLKQQSVQHRMLKDVRGSKTILCKHWDSSYSYSYPTSKRRLSRKH